MGPETLSPTQPAVEMINPGHEENREAVFEQFPDLAVDFNGEKWDARRIADECTFIGSMSVAAMVETFTAIHHDQIRKQELTPEELALQRAERMKNMAKRMEALDERQRQAAEKPEKITEEKTKDTEKAEREKQTRQVDETKARTVETIAAGAETTPAIKAVETIPAAVIAELQTEKPLVKPLAETTVADEAEAILKAVVEQQHRSLVKEAPEPETGVLTTPATPARHPETVVITPPTPDEIIWERELGVESADVTILASGDIITPATMSTESAEPPAEAPPIIFDAETVELPFEESIVVLPLPSTEIDAEEPAFSTFEETFENFEATDDDLDLGELSLVNEAVDTDGLTSEQIEADWLSEADQELLEQFRVQLGLEPGAEQQYDEFESETAEDTLSMLTIEAPVETSPEIIGMVEQIGEQLATLESEAAAQAHVQLAEFGKSLRNVEKLLNDDQTELSAEEITAYKEEITEQLQTICESLGLEYTEEEIKQLVELLLTQPELSNAVDLQTAQADGAETQLTLGRGTHETLRWFLATIKLFKKRLSWAWRYLGRQAMQPLIALNT